MKLLGSLNRDSLKGVPSCFGVLFRVPYVRDPVILVCRAPLKGFRVDIRQV